MKGFGCFVVTLLNCLIPRFLPISKGYTSQVRGECRPAPGFPGEGHRENPRPRKLEYPGQVELSFPETVRKHGLFLRQAKLF